MFVVFEITALEHVLRNSFIYDENTSDQQSTCYQTILRLQI